MNFIKYSALVPSLIATFFTFYGQLIFIQTVEPNLLYLSFLGTFIGYTLISFFSLNTKNNFSIKQLWIKQNGKALFVILILFAALSSSLITYLNSNQIVNYLHLAFIVFIYEKSIFSFHIRKIILLKPLIISYVWVMTCLGTVYFSKEGLNPFILLEGFLSIIPLSLFFDIRDYNQDLEGSFRTIVHRFGIKKTKSTSIRLYITSLLVRMTFIPFASYWWLYSIELLLFLALTKTIKSQGNTLKYLILVDGFIAFKSFYVLEHLL